MKRYIRCTSGGSLIYYKNVDICDLPSILARGILPMNESGNDIWSSGKRVNNSRDVVYLFRPTGYENSFVQYGVALLAVEVDGIENEMVSHDVNRGKYIEYVCDRVPPDKIRAVYIPAIFKDRINIRSSRIRWVGMEAKIFSDAMYSRNASMYGKRGSLGIIQFPSDFDEELNYESIQDDLLAGFAETAKIDDSSEYNYLRGIAPNGSVIEIKYVHYDI